jgi:hypothetical protein
VPTYACGMVKGNWERRAELGLLRKLEGKRLKEARKTPTNKALSPESVYTKLMKCESDLIESLSVYLESPPDAILVCKEHFRYETCNRKKCKLGHAR